MNDTIVALSSGRPPAAIAVIRISGPAAFTAARSLTKGPLPPPRRATLRALTDRHGELLDRALVLTFPGPRSATGEDVAELHCHGGRAVTAAVEEALRAIPEVRRAEPGEFTRRALLNGRLDLAQAEGLADLLAAETEAQRRAAVRTAEGGLSRRVGGWLDRVMALSAVAERAMDHDEDDEPLDPMLGAGMRSLAHELTEALRAPPVERLRDGVRVVIAGPPNAGKSTLLNALADREAAIVSPVAGTTRDRIEAPVQRGGLAFLFSDTAGLTATDDPVEAIGVARAREAISAADVVLWLDDGPGPAETALALHARADEAGREPAPASALSVSAHTGQGMEALWRALEARARLLLPADGQSALNARQRTSLAEAAVALSRGALLTDSVLVAEQLRLARRSLAAITGADATEAMLDALFSRFCLGK